MSPKLNNVQIGRGMRPSPETGKIDCHVIDIMDEQNRMGEAVSVPTLLGLSLAEFERTDSSNIRGDNPPLEQGEYPWVAWQVGLTGAVSATS